MQVVVHEPKWLVQTKTGKYQDLTENVSGEIQDLFVELPHDQSRISNEEIRKLKKLLKKVKRFATFIRTELKNMKMKKQEQPMIRLH